MGKCDNVQTFRGHFLNGEIIDTIPLAELVDLGGRGEVTERVERGAEAEEEVGMIWARGCSRA